ncbi:hypothetical protein [Rhodococcus wratislaviensis]|uniref:NB-ARC domain-containing protein n=1 Tax=Rhodococcus wratislaviensis NBRC 100605 TaxID=1219028 RepID=X0RET3_RHOWR|nr:hypothetical protein [Rhodococcus wratislaviensis]GAF49550.1 hypothetical protein RW1_093_00380 [Rhodococcus wratislaviensis NBRC 100605]
MVPRLSYLNELAQLFEKSTTTRRPRVAVLAGETGFGKSTIAAGFCHLNRHFYEKVCWIDCRQPELISAQIKDITARLTPAAADADRTADAFRTAIGESAVPFLLIFDGAGIRPVARLPPRCAVRCRHDDETVAAGRKVGLDVSG